MKNVIDGQQRLTMVVIFMSCLHHELISRTDVPDDVCLNELRMTYLTNMKGVQRFHTVTYDDPFFRKEIINLDAGTQEEKGHFLSKEALGSSSKQNIRDCRVCFDKKFHEADTATLVHWLELVEQFKDVENPVWDKACIGVRGKKIIEKAMEIWDLMKVMQMN